MLSKTAHWPRGSRRLRTGRSAVAVVGICVALGVSACSSGGGSGGSNSGSVGASTSDADGIAKAKSAITKLANQKFSVAPLSKKPPTGKTVAFVNCSLSGCNPGKMDAPAQALGWTVKEFSFDFSKGPQGFVAAIDAALASKPDYLVITQTYPDSVDIDRLNQAKAEGIPVILNSATDAPPPVVATTLGGAAYRNLGATEADEILALAGKPVEVAMPMDPTLPTDVSFKAGLKAELSRLSPHSTLDVSEVSLSSTPSTLIAQQVNLLRTHPKASFLSYGSSVDLFSGVSAALKGIGLNTKVKAVLGAVSNPTLAAEIADGDAAAGLAVPSGYQWIIVDLLARLAVGDPVGPRTPLLPWIGVLKPSNATPDSVNPPNFVATYKQAWHVG